MQKLQHRNAFQSFEFWLKFRAFINFAKQAFLLSQSMMTLSTHVSLIMVVVSQFTFHYYEFFEAQGFEDFDERGKMFLKPQLQTHIYYFQRFLGLRMVDWFKQT